MFRRMLFKLRVTQEVWKDEHRLRFEVLRVEPVATNAEASHLAGKVRQMSAHG